MKLSTYKEKIALAITSGGIIGTCVMFVYYSLSDITKVVIVTAPFGILIILGCLLIRYWHIGVHDIGEMLYSVVPFLGIVAFFSMVQGEFSVVIVFLILAAIFFAGGRALKRSSRD
jgi:uncharacterized membrane protein YbhN (UPF0104 family)